MKKVILMSAVALISASAFVSCGGKSEAEQKRIADSIANALLSTPTNLAESMKDTTATTTTPDTTKK